MRYNAETYRLEDSAGLGKPALIIGILGLATSVAGLAMHAELFYSAYLTAWLFWLGIGLGGLFLTMLHHLTGSVWSVTLRRITETLAGTLPLLAVLFIPILFSIHHLYEWSHPEALHDPILMKKAAWLNPTFFTIRSIIYLAIWSFLAWRLRTISLEQDKGGTDEHKARLVRVSAPGMIIFALSISFAAFDWMMSLTPHWYSTIYGVYFGMGSIMSMFAFLILTVTWLQAKGALKGVITQEHRHDMGKLFFAFIILWAYMAFSQYFLIWYANIPEETILYRQRWVGSWKAISMVIVFGHFVLPFFTVISRPAKRNVKFMAFICLWMLLMHYVDLTWNIGPTFSPEGFHLSPWHISTMFGIGGMMIFLFLKTLAKHPIVPVGDPKLEASINTISK